MFDLSIGKLIIIAAVALIVIGPERLPSIAKTAGLLVGRLQRYIAGIKMELRQEMEKAAFSNLQAEFTSLHDRINQPRQHPLAEIHNTRGSATLSHKTRRLIIRKPAKVRRVARLNVEVSTALSRRKTHFRQVPQPEAQPLPLFDDGLRPQGMRTEHCDRR